MPNLDEAVTTAKLVVERGEQYGAAHLTTSRIVQLLLSMHLLDKILASDKFFCWIQCLNKLVRALADPDYVDNWADIAGYAELVMRGAHHKALHKVQS